MSSPDIRKEYDLKMFIVAMNCNDQRRFYKLYFQNQNQP